jgi:hypothetical protein
MDSTSLGFSYFSPCLFILHFNALEVIRLTSTSFRSARLNESGSSEESSTTCPPPPGVFIDLTSPRYLGSAAEHYSAVTDNHAIINSFISFLNATSLFFFNMYCMIIKYNSYVASAFCEALCFLRNMEKDTFINKDKSDPIT